MSKIKLIKARKILDSRKRPTIEVSASADKFLVKAAVPSGASTGKYEAKIIDVDRAIENINNFIASKLIGKDPREQQKIDALLLELDDTENKSNLGGNAIVGISMAIARLGAKLNNIPLYQHIQEKLKVKSQKSKVFLPTPCFNIINGGAHAKNDLDIQEFMIVPQFKAFSENFKLTKKIYQKLRKIIQQKYKKIEMGDEGGFSPPISKAKEALDLIKEASNGFENIKIILDCAASQFHKEKKYKIEGKLVSKKELINYYFNLIEEYPIVGLEDPIEEEDFQGWKELSSKLQIKNYKLLFIGDDLTVTNPKRIKMAEKNNLCNGIIIKINQIGTVSEAIEAVELAKSFNWKIMVSHRSGETLDDFIADFAVGVGADFIKAGAPAKPERLAKYNRLLDIEKELKIKKMNKLVLLRHGESVWNKENRFTGWTDVGLTKKGIKEAIEAGKLLKKEGYIFDIAFVSVLKKATKTLDLVLKEMGLQNIPVKKSWRLNERFYGALQGLNKSEVAKKYGEDKVHLWRRSYNIRPPAITKDDKRYPGKDPLYKNLKEGELPLTESLKDVQKRLLPYWKSEILPAIKSGKRVLICAHGNSLRALIKHIDKISDKKIEDINIPTGLPLVYNFDKKNKPIKNYYLGGEKEIKKRIKAVIRQGKASLRQ